MFNFIIIVLLLHYVLFFILGRPSTTTLACGIWGWAGKDVKDFSKDRLNMLGIANQTRGKDSCGIGVNGNSFIGHGTTKLYENFVKENYHKKKMYAPNEVKSVIGHTRNASVGSVSFENAHPFGFGNLNDKFAFMGVHNGTIYNKEDLAKTFEIHPSKQISKNERIVKIDSEILLESIYRSKNFEVLSQYRGAAAIAFVNVKTPDTLYLFRGNSIKYNRPEDERPLYVYLESEDSLYFSSLATPLKWIGGTDDNVMEIDENTVYEIKDGNFEEATLFPVDRSEATQNMYETTYPVKKSTKTYKQRRFPYERDDDYYGRHMGWGGQDAWERDIEDARYENIPDDDEEEKDLNDSLTNDDCLVYKKNLRYYDSLDKLANGVYYFIRGEGLSFISEDTNEAKKEIKSKIGKYYYKGEFSSVMKDKTFADHAFIPFKMPESGVPYDYLFYIFEGCMLKLEKDYYMANVMKKTAPLSIEALSEISVYPVRNIKSETNSQGHLTRIMHNNVKYTGKVIPTGSTLKLYIKNGVLRKDRTSKSLTSDINTTHRPGYFDLHSKNKSTDKSKVFTLDPKKESSELKKFNEMAIEKAEEVLLDLNVSIDTISKEIEEYSKHKDIKKIKEALEKCEDILVEVYDDIFPVKKAK